MDKMLAAAKHLATRLHLGKSRRWKGARHGRRFDMRRTLRHSLQTGGEALIPLWLTHPAAQATLCAPLRREPFDGGA